ncbi:hypothetical protein AAC387_Pa04g2725 [Persea americana]
MPAGRRPFFLHAQTAPPPPPAQSPVVSPSSPSTRKTHLIHRTVLLVYYLPCSQFWAVAGVVTVLNSGIYIVLVFCS